MAIGRRSAIVVGDLLLLFVVLDVVVVVGFFQSQKTKEVDQTFFPFVTGRAAGPDSVSRQSAVRARCPTTD
jgi:hypothetical protein